MFFDLWVQSWRKRKAKGDVIVVRYADDTIVGFQHRWEAENFLNDLEVRLNRFGLSLHPDKTRLIEFGRFAAVRRKNRGQGKPETFDFLGMTHFCVKTLKGKFRVGRKPVPKRVRRTIRRIKEELRRRMHLGKHQIARWLGKVINEWLNYYAVPDTQRVQRAFIGAVKGLLLRHLRWRSQKDRTKRGDRGNSAFYRDCSDDHHAAAWCVFDGLMRLTKSTPSMTSAR